jgi:hypothetical protein
MIKLPIKPWTPPVVIRPPKPEKPEKPAVPQSPAASGGGGGGQTPSAIPTIEELFADMLKKYLPETVEFTPLSEEVLSETIRNWLRPAYEQAIQSRREQTGRINAELDADAWSRGMGQSTYLSDVKALQYRNESSDVDTLESNYAAALAGHLYDAIKAQQEKKIEVDEFNAEAINRAREKAMDAARALYQAYLSGTQGHGSGGRSRGADAEEAPETAEGKSILGTLLENLPTDLPKTDYRTAASIVARMTPQERKRFFNLSDPAYRKLRGELVYSLGRDGFNRLMQDYPA